MEPVTDMASLDGTWSIAGTTKLYFDSSGGYYIYRGCNGLGGRGEFSEVDGRPMIEFNGRRHPYQRNGWERLGRKPSENSTG